MQRLSAGLQVMLDEENKVLRPAKLWCDTESAQEAEDLSAAFNFQIPAGFTGEALPEGASSSRRQSSMEQYRV